MSAHDREPPPPWVRARRAAVQLRVASLGCADVDCRVLPLLSHRIASIDYKHPFVLSGSSDKHIRLLDISTLQGWSTNPAATDKPSVTAGGLGRTVSVVCEACGNSTAAGEPAQPPRRRAHEDLVRSVALNSDLVVSGSYDFTVKVRPAYVPSLLSVRKAE